jgi:hypothetical protein
MKADVNVGCDERRCNRMMWRTHNEAVFILLYRIGYYINVLLAYEAVVLQV